MKQVITKNLTINVNADTGKWFYTVIATHRGDIYGIDYQVKYDPVYTHESMIPALTTVATFETERERNVAAGRLLQYLHSGNEDAEPFYFKGREGV